MYGLLIQGTTSTPTTYQLSNTGKDFNLFLDNQYAYGIIATISPGVNFTLVDFNGSPYVGNTISIAANSSDNSAYIQLLNLSVATGSSAVFTVGVTPDGGAQSPQISNISNFGGATIYLENISGAGGVSARAQGVLTGNGTTTATATYTTPTSDLTYWIVGGTVIGGSSQVSPEIEVVFYG